MKETAAEKCLIYGKNLICGRDLARDRQGFFIKLALAAMLLPTGCLLCSLAVMMFGGKTGGYALILPSALMIIYGIWRDRKFAAAAAAVCVILAVWAAVCAAVYDCAYDSMNYHKQAVIALREGWNFLYGTAEASNPLSGYLDIPLWLNNYPRGIWVTSAAVYDLTSHLETAKSVNILFVMTVFAASFDVMRRVYCAGRAKSTVYALLFSINPVFVSQLFTSYNDLAAGALVITALLMCIEIIEGKINSYGYVLLFCVNAFSCNVKFSVPVMIGAELFACGIVCACKWRREPKRLIEPVCIVLASFVFGAGVLGFNPYITHIMQGKNPAYPLMGDGKVDIVSNNLPAGFDEKNGAERLFLSVFGKTDNSLDIAPEIKLPFTFDENEWKFLSDPDVRTGGFGVWSGGSVIISATLFVLFICRRGKRNMAVCYVSLSYALAVLVLMGTVFPESWWARYSSYLYYVPLFVLLCADSARLCSVSVTARLLGFMCAFAVFVNSALTLCAVISMEARVTADINYRLEQIKSSGGKIRVRVNDFPSHIKLFEEYGIDYEVSHTALDEPQIFYISTKYEYIK